MRLLLIRPSRQYFPPLTKHFGRTCDHSQFSWGLQTNLSHPDQMELQAHCLEISRRETSQGSHRGTPDLRLNLLPLKRTWLKQNFQWPMSLNSEFDCPGQWCPSSVQPWIKRPKSTEIYSVAKMVTKSHHRDSPPQSAISHNDRDAKGLVTLKATVDLAGGSQGKVCATRRPWQTPS